MKSEDGFDGTVAAVAAKLDKLANDLHARDEAVEQHQLEIRYLMLLTSAGVATAALLIILLANFLLYRVLMKLLGGEPAYAGKVARQIAAGDLTRNVQVRPDDQTSLLAHIAAMQHGLRDTVRQIRGGAEAVLNATRRLNGEAGQVVDTPATSANMPAMPAGWQPRAAPICMPSPAISPASRIPYSRPVRSSVPWARSHAASPPSSIPSTTSPTRPTCWH